jgi:hypothetical protein
MSAKRPVDHPRPLPNRFTSIVVILVSIVAVSVIVLTLSRSASAGGEATVSDVDCGILLPGILPEGQVISTIGTLVITPAGTATLTCRGELDPSLAPDHSVVITDVTCALGEGGQVGESHIQVSPRGQVLLVCHNNPGSEPFPTPGPDD